MSKRRGPKKGAPQEDPRFIQLDEVMLRSFAWHCLSPDGVWLYIELKRRWPGGETSWRTLPYDHVAFMLSWYRFKKARTELVGAGFIDHETGRGGLLRERARYRLSRRWEKVSAELLKARPWKQIRKLEPPLMKGDVGYSTGVVPVRAKLKAGTVQNLKQNKAKRVRRPRTVATIHPIEDIEQRARQ